MLLFVVAVATWRHHANLQLLPIFWYHKILVYYYYKLLHCKKFPVVEEPILYRTQRPKAKVDKCSSFLLITTNQQIYTFTYLLRDAS